MNFADIPDWPRRYFSKPAEGAGPFVYYVVFGPLDGGFEISATRYRCTGIPAGVRISSYSQLAYPMALDSFREHFLGEVLRESDPELAALVKAQTHCLLVQGPIEDGPTLNDFRNVIGLVTYLMDSGGVAVCDLQAMKWRSREQWRQEIFEPANPEPAAQTTIWMARDGENSIWMHTRGMRKFGRPDLSLRRVTPGYRDAVDELFKRLIGFQVQGGIVAEGQEIHMKGLPRGMRCHTRGGIDDIEFNNIHIDIEWPKY
ncbi:MAG: hypothetical protein LBL59_03655 [Xanthomonadaceae bacterium]|jgi:hypothetical protein|nr:hypothetical protein [Xanthomonadaceae bacterium]